MSKSIYDFKIKSWDGKEDFLADYKGKVSLVINTTAACGNAPQFKVIEEIYQTYKDQGFEVIAIPTNQYCGKNVTYGDWEDGIKTAADSKEHGERRYGTTYNFSEILVSKPGPGAPKGLREGEVPHELFEELVEQTDGVLMFGNFEKFLIDRDGFVVKRYPNGSLLDFATESGVPDSKSEYARICKDIEDTFAGIVNKTKLVEDYPEISKKPTL